jgi:hypothetical protein
MLNLTIEKTDFTPQVNFIFESKSLIIEGKSMPEDARSFYKPLLEWIDKLKNKTINKIELKVKLSYFNSSTSKQLLKLFYALEDLEENNIKCILIWVYESNDTMIKNKGKEFEELVELPFYFKEII